MKQKTSFYISFDAIVNKRELLTKEFLDKFIGMPLHDEDGNIVGYIKEYNLEHRWFIGVGEAEVFEKLNKRPCSVGIKTNEKARNGNDLISW